MRRKGPVAWLLRRVTGRPSNLVPAFWFSGKANFGDLIAPVILRSIFHFEPALVSKSYSPKLLSTGSVLSAAKSGDAVWGSGLLMPQRIDGRGIRFLAVRGPRSRSLIDGDVPETYGDPAILLPKIHTPHKADRRFKVGVILHYHHKDASAPGDPSVLWLDVQDPDWMTTVDRINQCDVIVSSSLHGLIVAETYGIPAVWVQPSGNLKGGTFKFHDYYEGTGREAKLAEWKRGLGAVVEQAEQPPRLDHGPLVVGARQALTDHGWE